MALIKSVRGFTPQIGENTYLSENATIVGDVTIGKDCSIWFNAVLRGDVNPIRIGDRVNIQDGSVLHTLYERSVVEIGNDVSVGHNVTIHGATIKDGALIGMGSTILDYAVVGEGAIVAAGALVLSNTVIEPGTLWAGVPAKFIKKIPCPGIGMRLEHYNHSLMRIVFGSSKGCCNFCWMMSVVINYNSAVCEFSLVLESAVCTGELL